jgi:PAS domain S-box-containing protein
MMLAMAPAEAENDEIRVLLVEDDVTDVDLIGRVLARFKGARFVLTAVDRMGGALAHVAAQGTDVVILDMTLPDGSGLSLLGLVLRSLPEIPVVVLTGSQDESLPLRAVKMGAQDFLKKEHIVVDERLPRALLFAIERRRWHEQIERSQQQLEEAQAATHVGSWHWDRRSDKVTLSRELGRLCGLEGDPRQHTYQEFLALVDAEDRGRADATFRNAIQSLMPFSCEYRVVLPGGRTRSLQGRGRALTDATGSVYGLAGSAQDLTERKEMEAQLLVAGRMVAVGTLAAGVAHEINNPLASILGNLEYLNGHPGLLAPGVGEVLRDLKESSRRIRDVVQNLMMFSAGDADTRSVINVRHLLDAVLDVVGNSIHERAQLTREYEETPLVVANEARLAHAFLQLLINAAQAIPAGAPARHEVRVRTFCDRAGRVHVEIRDDGVGIPPEIRARIFDPFFTTKPVGTATGLGLTMAHAIVSASGGTLAVESEVGEGSVFSLILPAAGRAPLTEPAVSADGRQRVMVVDDDPQVGHMLRRLLAREYDVIVATDATTALARLESARIDVILCDLMMPEVSGIEFYERVKRTSPRSLERLIFMTAGAFTEHFQSFVAQLDTPCLRKPFDPEALFGALRHCLDRVGARPL